MRILILLIAVPFLANCGGGGSDGSNTGLGGSCQFSLSGDASGNHGGSVLTDDFNNMYWYNCSNGPIAAGPEVSVGIDKAAFVGAGTYPLGGVGTDGIFLVATDDGTVYRADSTSANCQAVFTSATQFSFQCSNIPEEGGAGSVSVSAGSFQL